MNVKKFKNANYDKNEFIDKKEFSKFCLVDVDYKTWMYNMGFISKKQLNSTL